MTHTGEDSYQRPTPEDKATEQSIEQTQEQSLEQTQEQSIEQSPEQSIEQSSEQSITFKCRPTHVTTFALQFLIERMYMKDDKH